MFQFFIGIIVSFDIEFVRDKIKKVKVSIPITLNDNQIKTLRQAIAILRDTGHTVETEIIVRHVLDKSHKNE